MVVGTISHGPMRFDAIMRQDGGVSHWMPTLTPRGLERDGLVSRTAWPAGPPKVDDALADLGRSLIQRLKTRRQWTLQNRSAIEASRVEHDRTTTKT